MPAGARSRARIILHATRAPDYGKLAFTVNNKPAGAEFDGYSANPAPSGPVEIRSGWRSPAVMRLSCLAVA